MTPDRWHQLQDLFAQALALPSTERDGFIDRATGGDMALAAELRALLAGDATNRAGADESPTAAVSRAAAQWVDAQRHGRLQQRLGPWRLVAHLADGGMGAVYLGERADGQYTQRVAVKLINPAFVSADAHARLAQERQILARLSHPHIARLLDGGATDDGVPYLVMEYVDGVPIDRWCRDHATDVPTRLRLFVQVCRAVDHAHRNLVVHRDLKPRNILVDADGAPRLLDFGIAKLVDVGADVTASGERLLTPSHASPEQVTGGPITTATDVYALGVLLYDLLTGRLPHAAVTGNAAALARAIVETDPPRPSAAAATPLPGSAGSTALPHYRARALTPERLARKLRGDLDTIVLMALRKEPERRYASAADLADDIERHLARLPVRARPDTWRYRLTQFARRHPVGLPVSLLAGTAVVAGSVAFTWQLAQQREAAERERAVSERVTGFMTSLFESASPEASPSTLTARQVMTAAAARVDTELAGQPDVQVHLWRVMGRAFRQLEMLDRAEEVLRKAIDAGDRDPRADTVQRARAMIEVSNLLGHGMRPGAVEMAERADATMRRLPDAPLEQLMRARHNVVYRLQEAGRTPEALQRAAALVADLRRAPRVPWRDDLEAKTVSTMAFIHTTQGEPGAAVRVFRHYFELRPAPDHADLDADSGMSVLSWNLIHSGRLAEADALSAELSVRMHRWFKPDQDGPFAVDLVRAVLADQMDRPEEAAALLRELQGRVPPHREARNLGWVQGEWGRALWHAGRLTEAQAVLQRCLQTFAQHRTGGHTAQRASAALAAVAFELGQTDEALRRFADAKHWADHYKGRMRGMPHSDYRAEWADVALAMGRVVDARASVDAGLRELAGERASNHPQRARLQVLDADVALAEGRLEAADEALKAVEATFGAIDPVPPSLRLAHDSARAEWAWRGGQREHPAVQALPATVEAWKSVRGATHPMRVRAQQRLARLRAGA